jgi:hypothetical protein
MLEPENLSFRGARFRFARAALCLQLRARMYVHPPSSACLYRCFQTRPHLKHLRRTWPLQRDNCRKSSPGTTKRVLQWCATQNLDVSVGNPHNACARLCVAHGLYGTAGIEYGTQCECLFDAPACLIRICSDIINQIV